MGQPQDLRAEAVMGKVVAIHQPNFYPWLGFFDKWVRADALILLDDVQFPKTGGTWTNRCRILASDQAAWITAPIARNFRGTKTIQEIELQRGESWRGKLLRRFSHAYASAPMLGEAREPLVPDLLGGQDLLIDLNLGALRRLGDALGLDQGKVILASSLDCLATSTERLVMLVQKVGGDTYLCGGGASGYQRDEAFAEAGITLRYQNYLHPLYTQGSSHTFTPGLSILDSLSYLGSEGVSRLLHQNQGSPECARG